MTTLFTVERIRRSPREESTFRRPTVDHMRHGGAAFAVPEGVEDELIALLAQGWMVAPDSALEFEFGEKTAVVSRIRVVKKRKPKAG